MRQNGNIHLQDPSVSPTFALSHSANHAGVPASLRRNLFASHLSRRPVPRYASSGTEATNIPDPFQAQSLPSSSHYPVDDRFSQTRSVHQSQHAMNPTVHHGHAPDSRISPSRSISPSKNPSVLAGAGIVAIDPVTGRPALPVLPTLPARLRAGDNEEDEVEDGDPEDGDDPDLDYDHSGDAPYRRTRTFDRAIASQRELDLHSSSLIGPSQPRLYELIDAGGSVAADGTDYNKIESILSEMQSQQKARARTAVLPESMSSLSNDPSTNDSRISARTRGKSRANARGPASGQDGRNSNVPPSRARVGGVGATLKPADKEELLGLIMTSLTRRVHEADQEAWMFGDESHTGVSGFSESGAASFMHARELHGAVD